MISSKKAFPALLILAFAAFTLADSFNLHFSATIENEETEVFPDSFLAFGRSASEPNSLMTSMLRQPPPPPTRNYVQLAKNERSEDWLRTAQFFDPNAPELIYSMTFSAHDPGGTGLSGDSIVTLENPEALNLIPSNSLVYLRRFDSNGLFIQSYDLLDPANHSIQWSVAGVNGKYAGMDLLIIDMCLAADLAVSNFINLEDFAVLAADWNRTDIIPGADIFLDNKVDIKDLSILAGQWLCSCTE